MTKRLDLRVDFAFKSLFGTLENESILATFLNAALRFPDEKKIQTAQLLNPHFNKENQEGIDSKMISKLTGLTIEEVEKLRYQ
ncbi:PD-(D/E)XK nuclease family transposase [Priestia megaterium]|uniref:PD-(D/E)XK nuclease family transposase n=1 Tax=Priestia megaterium TaxID=1404 RepID=UPI002FFED3E8